jgi:hypothetical protein
VSANPPAGDSGILPYVPLLAQVDIRALRYGPAAFAVLACVSFQNDDTTHDPLSADFLADRCHMSVEEVEQAVKTLVQANLLLDDRAPF